MRVETEGQVVCVIEHEQPLLMLPTKPIKCSFLRLPYSFGKGNIAEAHTDGVLAAGVKVKDV